MSEPRRRSDDFIQRLSLILVVGAFLGGYIVLLEIKAVLTIYGQVISVGDKGFAAEVKGMVLQSMLISGFAAVVAYWLSTTKQGQDQAQTVSQLAAAATPDRVAAVAAARAPALPEAPASETVTPGPVNPATGVTPAKEVVTGKPEEQK